jgi:hypothetical protein
MKRSSAHKNNGDVIHSTEDKRIVDCQQQIENVTSQLRKCGPWKASLCVMLFEGARLLTMSIEFGWASPPSA